MVHIHIFNITVKITERSVYNPYAFTLLELRLDLRRRSFLNLLNDDFDFLLRDRDRIFSRPQNRSPSECS